MFVVLLADRAGDAAAVPASGSPVARFDAVPEAVGGVCGVVDDCHVGVVARVYRVGVERDVDQHVADGEGPVRRGDAVEVGADGDDDVRRLEGALCARGQMAASDAEEPVVVLGEDALPLVRRHDRRVERVGEAAHSPGTALGAAGTAADVEKCSLGRCQQGDRLVVRRRVVVGRPLGGDVDGGGGELGFENVARDAQPDRAGRRRQRRLQTSRDVGGEVAPPFDVDVRLHDVVVGVGGNLVYRSLPALVGVDVGGDVENRYRVLVRVLQPMHRVRVARAGDGERRRGPTGRLVIAPRDVRDSGLVTGHHVAHLVALDDRPVERERLGPRDANQGVDAGVDQRLVHVGPARLRRSVDAVASGRLGVGVGARHAHTDRPHRISLFPVADPLRRSGGPIRSHITHGRSVHRRRHRRLRLRPRRRRATPLGCRPRGALCRCGCDGFPCVSVTSPPGR